MLIVLTLYDGPSVGRGEVDVEAARLGAPVNRREGEPDDMRVDELVEEQVEEAGDRALVVDIASCKPCLCDRRRELVGHLLDKEVTD